jgi:hypothetical protein
MYNGNKFKIMAVFVFKAFTLGPSMQPLKLIFDLVPYLNPKRRN